VDGASFKCFSTGGACAEKIKIYPGKASYFLLSGLAAFYFFCVLYESLLTVDQQHSDQNGCTVAGLVRFRHYPRDSVLGFLPSQYFQGRRCFPFNNTFPSRLGPRRLFWIQICSGKIKRGLTLEINMAVSQQRNQLSRTPFPYHLAVILITNGGKF